MIRIIHGWLLVILYGSATWLRHRATTWQRLLRHSLLPYAVRHYQSRWPETAKAVKHWQERLREADNPIAPVNHRRPLPDDCHCPECSAPREYLYNYGYSHGHSGDEAFHKGLCKICVNVKAKMHDYGAGKTQRYVLALFRRGCMKTKTMSKTGILGDAKNACMRFGKSYAEYVGRHNKSGKTSSNSSSI